MAAWSGTYCIAWGCDLRFTKEAGIPFHTFPLKDKERLKKLLIALRRYDFKPTVHTEYMVKSLPSYRLPPFGLVTRRNYIDDGVNEDFSLIAIKDNGGLIFYPSNKTINIRILKKCNSLQMQR